MSSKCFLTDFLDIRLLSVMHLLCSRLIIRRIPALHLVTSSQVYNFRFNYTKPFLEVLIYWTYVSSVRKACHAEIIIFLPHAQTGVDSTEPPLCNRTSPAQFWVWRGASEFGKLSEGDTNVNAYWPGGYDFVFPSEESSMDQLVEVLRR